jgi:hypothetical protein
MAPKKFTSSTAGGRTKKAAGIQVSFLPLFAVIREKLIIQPTLAFSQRKPGAGAETGKTKSTTSISSITPSIKREDSTTSIDLTADEAPAASTAPHPAAPLVAKKERKTLNVKSKEWNGVYNDAKTAMGNMEPSKLSLSCTLRGIS